MNSIYTCIFCLVFCFVGGKVLSQAALSPTLVQKFSLNEVVVQAKENSIASLQAVTVKENRYWQWRTYLSDYKPQLILKGELPGFSRIFDPVKQPDGTIAFRRIANNNSWASMDLSQYIGATGGQIFVSSQLQRIDDFERKQTSYGGSPAVIGFNQPLFTFNELRWNRKIEPLRYEESQKQFVEDMEEIALRSSELFFDLLLAQISFQIAKTNVANTDTIFKIAQVRYQLGKMSKSELLQVKLSLLNANKAVAQAQLGMETSTLLLKSYIGFTDKKGIELELPSTIPVFTIDEEVAIMQALQNRQEAVAFKRLLVEADRDIAQARGRNGLNANLFAAFGFANQAQTIPAMYVNPSNQQELKVGFQIPVVDWGRSASRIKTAEANRKLVQYTIKQNEINFKQEIYTLVKQLNMLREQVALNESADQTAQERYEIAKNRYLLGDLGVTDLNIALQEKDQAKREYITSLRDFWTVYYGLRLLTLYDFERKEGVGY